MQINEAVEILRNHTEWRKTGALWCESSASVNLYIALDTILTTFDKPSSRYPWESAPEWAMWAATDDDGCAYWHGGKEHPEPGEIVWLGFGVEVQQIPGRQCFGWRESLEARPCDGVKL